MLVKEPKAEAIHFAATGNADASSKEVLFWSFMLCVTHRGRIKELDTYARKVTKEELSLNTVWKP